MNIFCKVTVESLKKNKVRTIVTIIGIILSAAMICAVTTSVISFQSFMVNYAIYEEGDWHGSAVYCDWATYEDISESEEVESLVADQIIGYAWLDGCKNEEKPYLFVVGAGDGYEATMPIRMLSGSYPANSHEIIISEEVAYNGDVNFEIGQSITLELGDRVSEGYTLTQYNTYAVDNGYGIETSDEELVIREERTYTVVGIYERPAFEEYTAPGYTAITLADETGRENYASDIFFKMKNPNDVYSFMSEKQLTGTTNSSLLMYLGTSKYSSFMATLDSIAAILIVLIMFGSVSLIYNAFSISISERTKQFGLLSSIGATKKQLSQMVLFEALIVSAVGIPLGVLAGIGGIGITLIPVGKMLLGMVGPIKLELKVSFGSIAIAAAVALVTVLISAWIPSVRATKISAIDAIRQSKEVAVEKKSIQIPKLVYQLFGLPGMLASKYFKRSKKKYRATIASLFMSVVLFISAFSFSDYLMQSVSDVFYTSEYDISVKTSVNEIKDQNEFLSKLQKADAVTDVALVKYKYGSAKISAEDLTAEYKYLTQNDIAASSGATKNENVSIYVVVYFVDDASFRKLLQMYDLDEAVYTNTDAPLGIAMNRTSSFNQDEGKYTSVDIAKDKSFNIEFECEKKFEGYNLAKTVYDESGNVYWRYVSEENDDYIDLPIDELYEYSEMTVGTTIYQLPYFAINNIGGSMTIFYHESMEELVCPQASDEYNYFITSDDHTASFAAIKKVLIDNGLPTSRVYDAANATLAEKNLVKIIKIFAYGFIVLISLISAANVFNTIVTNINLRRREFAMLKSVGMTSGGFNKMMNYECTLYGAKALLFGLPTSVLVSYLIHSSFSLSYLTQFNVPWVAIGIATFSVFAVVFSSMMYSMSKIKKDNPIDALKNENL